MQDNTSSAINYEALRNILQKSNPYRKISIEQAQKIGKFLLTLYTKGVLK